MSKKKDNFLEVKKRYRQRISNLSFIIAIALLIVFMLLTYLKFNSFRAQVDKLDHTHNVLKEVVELEAAREALSSSEQNYLLTSKKEFLKEGEKEIATMQALSQKLTRLTADNPAQNQTAYLIKNLVRQRIMDYHYYVKNGNPDGWSKEEMTKFVQTHNDSELTNVIKKLHESESSMLIRRELQKKSDEDVSTQLMAITAIISLGLILTGFLMLSFQLKERYRVLKLLEENIYDLRLSKKQLEQFTRVSSHDLQEPLRKIKVFSNYILSRKDIDTLPETVRFPVERIAKSANHLTLLIKGIVNYSTVISGHSDTKTAVDLNAVWEKVKDEFSAEILKHQVGFHVLSLPVVLGNEPQLSQLFTNLLSNSLKFRSNQRRLSISLIAEKKRISAEDFLMWEHAITFKDNGIGFDNNDNEKVFGLFSRLNVSNQGTGIGLAICRQVMENHGGQITVSSRPDEGAAFKMIFPAND